MKRKTPKGSVRAKIVFLFDVDNTLLDNDQVIADLGKYLKREVGPARARFYWRIFEKLRTELGYADYLGALQRYRSEYPHDLGLLAVSRFLINYPFANRLFPNSLDVIERVKQWGSAVLLTDGDVVFQPRKVDCSGLYEAVDGHALIYVHKEHELADVEARYPADHYVMVDDKLRILAAVKNIWGLRVTTVFVRQGHYARDPKIMAACPAADLNLERIGALLNYDLQNFFPRAAQVKRAPVMQKGINMSVPRINAKTGGRGGKRMLSAEPWPIVLTIGHSTYTLEEFIGLLQAHGATGVVDVRTVPRSRHNPQFNKASLPGSLKKAGLGYVHLPGLGGLRHAKRDSINLGWRNASFRGYADYMQTPEFEQSLDELIQLANQERIVLMCAEAVPWRCHRSLIADALLVRGIRTEDIMSPTRRQVHTLTSFAKVRGTTITYPADASPGAQKTSSIQCSRSQPVGKTRQTKATAFTP